MIVFVTPRAGSFGIDNYLASWGEPVAARFRVLHYEDLATIDALPAATYVFSAFDRLLPTELELVAEMRARLADSGRCGALLNDPAQTLRRSELLDRLYAHGWNTFRAVPATNRSTALRFPVFVREANGHGGSLTPLLPDRARLQRAMLRLRIRGYRPGELLVVEFCPTANACGTYRKYSAFVLAGRVLARSLNIGTDWVTKHRASDMNEVRAREEYDYIEANPHADRLAETFALAGTEYGRIDYGMLGDQIQTWEINLNPTIGGGNRQQPVTAERLRIRQLTRPARQLFFDRFGEIWRALDCASDPCNTIAWRVSTAQRAAIEAERRARARDLARKRRRARIIATPPVRALRRVLRSG